MRYMTWDYKDPIRPMFWLPEAQTAQYDDPAFTSGEIWSHYLYNIVIWAPGNPPGMEEQVRKALASVDPDPVLYGVDPYGKVLSGGFPAGKHDRDPDDALRCAGTGVGGGRAVWRDGLHGGTAHQRDRRAHGAGRGSRQVVRMVLRGAFSQIGIGLALGIPAAIGAGKLMTDQLFGVKPWDPVMLTAATLLLGLAALLASSIPARRAAGVEPMVALRNE